MTDRERIDRALDFVRQGVDEGDHHRMWYIDQMVRALTGCPIVELESRFPDAHGEHYTYMGQGESAEYRAFVLSQAEWGWDEGIAP